VHDEFDNLKKTCSLESTVEAPKFVRISRLKLFFKIKKILFKKLNKHLLIA
jgi:hypothetical protein